MKVVTIALVFLAGALTDPSNAQQAPFTVEQVMSAPFASGLTASPKGIRVAWFANEEGRRNLWVADGPGLKAKRITHFTSDDGQALSDLTWSPNGQALVFVRGEGRNTEGEFPNPVSDPSGTEQALWSVSVEGGGPRRIGSGAQPTVSLAGQVAFINDGQVWSAPLSGSMPPQQLFSARGIQRSPQWSPDGTILAFVSDRGDHSFIGLYDATRSSVAWVAPSVDRDHTPRWSPSGREIAFIRQPGRGGDPPPADATEVPDPWSIWLAEVGSTGARRLWTSTALPDGSLPRMAGEGILQWGSEARLVFASEEDGWMHLYSIASSGGAPTLLTPGPCEFEEVAASTGPGRIVYSSNCGDINRRHLWSVPSEGGSPTQLTKGENIEFSPAILVNGDIAFLRSDARLPASPYVMGPDGAGIRNVAPVSLPDGFPSARLAVPKQVLFKSPDGWEIHGQLFVARTEPGRRLPAVIFMHGGPVRQMFPGWHNRYYYHNAYAMNQYLASRGYAVLSVNFRSGIGYGRRFREAPGRGPRGASEYQDIVAAARYLQSMAEIDRERIGLWGGSYGGYLTALGLARNSELFAAGVDLHGVHDWSTRRFRRWAGTESPDIIRRARESSPVDAVDRWRSPVLLVHGDDDRNVDFSQTVDLAQRLRKQNVTFEQLVFPDEVHDFLLHRHWVEVFRAAADFFDRHLKKP